MKNDKLKMKIAFPNLILIPVLSALCSTIKLCGGTEYDWMHVIISMPIALYFIWCVGYCLLATCAILLAKMIETRDK